MNLVCLLFGIMDAAGIVVVSNENVNAFSEQQENENTIKENARLYDLKIFSKVATKKEEYRIFLPWNYK